MTTKGFSLSECFENFKNLIFNRPPLFTKIDYSQEPPLEDYFIFKKELSEKIRKKRKLIFIIGKSGVGKTHFVNKFISEENPGYYFRPYNFMGISSINDAYLYLLGLFKIVFVFMLFFILINIINNVFGGFGIVGFIIVLILGYVLVSNKFKITYSLGEYFSYLFKFYAYKGLPLAKYIYEILEKRNFSYFNKWRVLYLEDLDMSSMNEKDKWSMFSNLWFLKTIYVVCLSYKNQEDENILKEKCKKCEGEIICIKQSAETNIDIFNFKFGSKYLGQEYYKIPFNKHMMWMKIFTPREVNEIISEFDFKFSLYSKFCQEINTQKFFGCLILRVFVDHYFKNLEILELKEKDKHYLITPSLNDTLESVKDFQSTVDQSFLNVVLKDFMQDESEKNKLIYQIFFESIETMLKKFS